MQTLRPTAWSKVAWRDRSIFYALDDGVLEYIMVEIIELHVHA